LRKEAFEKKKPLRKIATEAFEKNCGAKRREKKTRNWKINRDFFQQQKNYCHQNDFGLISVDFRCPTFTLSP